MSRHQKHLRQGRQSSDRIADASHKFEMNDEFHNVLKSELPEPLAAYSFVCKCFGLTHIQAGKISDPTSKLRQRLHRRFNRGKMPKRRGKAQAYLDEKLYGGFRGHKPEEFGRAYKVADDAVHTGLAIYDGLQRKLTTTGRDQAQAMWILAEHVLAPTLVIIFGQQWRTGLGREYQGEHSWYLPLPKDGVIHQPFTRVFNYWTRIMGHDSPNRLATALIARSTDFKTIGRDTLRKRLERWSKGDETPSCLADLYGVIDVMKEEVQWLSDRREWKARFLLAMAMQKLFEEAENYFKELHKTPSLQLREWIIKAWNEPIYQDYSHILAQPTTHFAVRMLVNELKKSAAWEGLIKPFSRTGGFDPDIPDEEIEHWRIVTGKAAKGASIGNQLANHIRYKAQEAGRVNINDTSAKAYIELQDFIFELGVDQIQREINTLR